MGNGRKYLPSETLQRDRNEQLALPLQLLALPPELQQQELVLLQAQELHTLLQVQQSCHG